MFFQTESSVMMYSLAMLESLPMFGKVVCEHIDREITRRLRKTDGFVAEAPLRCRVASAASGLRFAGGVKRRGQQSCASSRATSVGSDTQSHTDETAVDNPSIEACVSLRRVGSFESSQGSSASSVPSGTRVSWQDCRGSLETCHRNFLVNRIHDLEGKLQRCKTELAKSKRSHKASNNHCNQLMLKMSGKNSITDESALSIRKNIRPNGEAGRFTVRGYLAMGIRKSPAITSALGFPMSALVDVSRQTVTRAEITIWSVLVARTGMFHTMMRDRLRKLAGVYLSMQEPDPQDPNEGTSQHDDESDQVSHEALVSTDLRFAGHSIEPSGETQLLVKSLRVGPRNEDTFGDVFCLGGTALAGDATNSGIWRRNKLQGLLLTSACMIDAKQLSSETDYFRAFAFHTTVFLACMSKNRLDR